MRLQDRVAIVTGAARGIGRAYAQRFAEEGAAVAVFDLREADAKETAELIRSAGGSALALQADVTDQEQMVAAAQQVVDAFGGIDVLVNNAALYGDMDLADQSTEYFTKVLNTNVLSVVVASRAVFPHLKQRGGGSIINIASTAAYPLPLPMPTDLPTIPVSGYAVSKAAVINLTKWMATVAGPANIRVNAIAPGLTMTEATQKVVPGPFMEQLTRATALRKSLEAGDLTGTAVYLASDDSALMTGQVLVVDAGLIMLG
ncbi:MAG: glucose 1-dehydrogenase [Dehalococcoidia bacterium]